MKKAFYKLLLLGIDYPPNNTIGNVILTIIFYSVGPGLIIFLSGYLFWQFIVAVIFVFFVIYSLLRVSVISQLNGAELALRNPPAIGETWIEVKDGAEIYWKSEKFVFSPGKKPGAFLVDVQSRGERKYKHYWEIIKDLDQQGRSYVEMRNRIKDVIGDEPSDDTLGRVLKKHRNK